MPTVEIKRFNASLELDAEMINFKFHPVNVRTKQLYQVYIIVESKEHRFHMQGADGLNFRITDRESCPQKYLVLESQLSEAIAGS